MAHSEGFLAIVNDAKSRVTEITLDEYQKMKGSGGTCSLIDVREDNEWTAGHAAGAIHLSKGILERDIEQTIPEKSSTLVLYCGGGFRSALACDSIQKMGYSRALSLAGGWKAWVAAGMPVDGGA